MLIAAIILLIIISTIFGFVYTIRQRRRINSIVATTQSIASPDVTPEQAQYQTEIEEILADLSSEEVAAVRLEASAQALIPVSGESGTDEQPLKPLGVLLDLLAQHSLIVAGMEQVLLNISALPEAAPIEQLSHFWYAAMIPEHLQEAGAGI